MPTRYRPAHDGWFAVCSLDVTVAVDPGSSPELLQRVWESLDTADPTSAALDEITTGGISHAPGFAIIDRRRRDPVVTLRGAVSAALPTGEHVTGVGASPWVETPLPSSGSVIVTFGGGAGDAGDAPDLPIERGIVRCDRLSVHEAGWPAVPTSTPNSADVAPPVDAPQAAPTSAGSSTTPPEPVAGPISATPTPSPAPPTAKDRLSETTRLPEPEGDLEPSGGAGYDHLFGHTVVRSVEDAAVRAEEHGDDADSADDRTRVATDLAARRALRRAARGTKPTEPSRSTFWLDLSTGGTEALDGTVIVGRAPSANRVAGGAIPRLVTMTTPNQDISRTHAQIALEGGTVVVTDLHSSNGTFVTLPGRAPQKLRGGDPMPVIPGAVIDLGDGATLTVREET